MTDQDPTHRAGRRRGRTVRALPLAAGLIIVAFALYAVTGFFAVPRLARWALQTSGSQALHRAVTVSEVTFNPLTLDASLRALRIRDRDGQPLASIGRLRLRLRPSGVFHRTWHLGELAIDQPAFNVRFLPNGKLSIADLLSSDHRSQTPRLIIDRLTLRGGRLDYEDESVTPRLTAAFTPLNAVVRDLITIPGAHGEHVLSIGFDRNSTVRIAGRQTLEPLGLSGHIDVSRIAVPALASRFAPASPLLVRKGEADAGLDYELRKEGAGVRLRVSRGSLDVNDIALVSRQTDAELLNVPRLEVRGASIAFPERTADIASIRIAGPRGPIAWDPRGRFNWSAAPAGAAQPATTKSTPAAPPWKLRIAQLGIEQAALHYEDQQTSPPVAFDVTGLKIAAGNLTSDASKPVAFTAAGTTAGGRLALNGTIVPSPFSLDTSTSLGGIDLLPFRPYIAAVPGLTLAAGSAGFDGRLLISAQQPYLVEGNGVVNGIEFLDASNNRLLGCRTSTLHQLRLDGSTSRFRIGSAGLEGLYANVVIDKQRNINLAAIGASSGTPAAPQKGSVDIGTIDIRNATVDYRDDSLVLPFSTAITSTTGTITDFSTTSAAAATIRLAGNVAEHGSMKAEGTMRMADPFAGSNLFVHFRGVPMPALTPYSAEFAGYEIQRGDLDVDVRYHIADRKLQGDHRVTASGLTLGRKVGATKAGFAVRLAVALLKDRQGRIDLEVPIEGTIDSPEFNYRVVLWQAVKTILGNTVKAPFRALGRAIGSSGEDLDVVSFDPGDSTVIPPEAEKLRKIGDELAARDELDLGVEGRFDPELDMKAMKRAKFESLVATRRGVPAAGASEPPSLDGILESLYAAAFSPERLAEERAKFTTTPPAPPVTQTPRGLWRRKPPAPPAPPPPTFNANGFYDALRAQLIASQTISTDELRSLGRARAAAIAAVLTSGGTIAPARVRVLDPIEAKPKPGSRRIEAEMTLSAVGAAPNETADE